MSRSYVTYRFIEAIFIDLFQADFLFMATFHILSLACLLKIQKLKNSNSSYPLATSVLARTERDSVYEFCSFVSEMFPDDEHLFNMSMLVKDDVSSERQKQAYLEKRNSECSQ